MKRERADLTAQIGRSLLLILLLAAPLLGQPAEQEVSAVAIAQDAFRLTPSEPSVTRPLVVDATAAMSVAVTAASQTLQVSLEAPDGTRYYVGDPSTPDFESGFFPIDSTATTKPGASYLINIENPARGTWSLEVTERATLTAPLNAVALAMLNNDVRAVLLGGGDTYPLGTNTRLALVVFDGAAKVRGLSIDARFFRPSDATFAPASIAFRDDGTGADTNAGDGIYQAFASAPAPGRYQVHLNARGSASTGTFLRTAATEFRVVARRANIDGLFSDRGIDANFDTLLDQIGVTPRATVLESGTYNVGVRLRGSNGRELLKSVERNFTPGPVAPEVTFETADIVQEIGVDGPYQVAEIRFMHVTDSDVIPADIRYDLGATAAYRIANFQRPRLRLSGTGSSTGVDFDGNGQFDQLNITIGVIADFAGFYSFSAQLTDRNGKELGFRSGSRSFAAGANQVTFTFPGRPIGENGVDGPYFLSNLLMFGAGHSLIADTALTTSAFLARQFEGSILDTTPPVLSVSVSPSVLYPPNHQMIEITPTIEVSDDRDPDPKVDLVSITSNEGDDVRGDGNTSNDILIDNGRIFLRAERSGLADGRIYTITWRARDLSGNFSMASATVTVPHDKGNNK